MSRFENSITIKSLNRLRDVLIDPFIASFETPPLSFTFDRDAVDDPAHGAQQLVLFHGYFEQYQYFPMFITCAENDLFVMISLRPGAVHAALGAMARPVPLRAAKTAAAAGRLTEVLGVAALSSPQ